MKHAPDLTRLAQAYEFIARMVAERPDGAAYLPVFERLEAEIEAVADRESAVERARRVSRERAGRAGA